ncbi:MFS transporter [Gottfriedia acidiceleris]|uniref:MFS transporter n=1 Tax=Gottfriedia acidiceleris TaxID=371036 RepID=UPI003D258546
MIQLIRRNKNFRFLFLGRLITNMGDSLYTIASMWLVFQLSHNTFYSGVAGFLTELPSILAIFIGPIIDRINVKKVLIVSEISQCILVSLIPILHYMDLLSVTSVLIIMPLASIFVQLTYPSESVLLPNTVNEEELVPANSAMSFAYQGTSLIFNSLAGLLIVITGAINIFVIDVFSFLIAACLFNLIKIHSTNLSGIGTTEENNVKNVLNNYRQNLKEGIKYVFIPTVFKLYSPAILTNFAFSATYAVLPAFSDKIGGAKYYGLFMAALTGGALIGAIFAHKLSKIFTMGKILVMTNFITGLLWFGAYLCAFYSPLLGLVLLVFAGIPFGIKNVLSSSMLQKLIPNQIRGRVTTVIGSMIQLAMPLGALVGGWLATFIAAEWILYVNGFLFMLISIYWWLSREIISLPTIETINMIPLEKSA